MISLIAPEHHFRSSFFFLPRFPNFGSRSSLVICYNINDVSGLHTVLSHTPITSAVSSVTLACFKKLHPDTENT